MSRPGERLEELGRGTLKILQRPDGFCFGMDSVLLAAFAAERSRGCLAADLGTGSGVLPLLIGARVPGMVFDAVEIQAEVADMARRSVALNGLEERIRVHAMDMRDAPKALGYERYRLVVCNPPYTQVGGGLPNPSETRRIARYEAEIGVEEICRVAGQLLQNGGRFAAVFRPQRMLALMDAMRDARVEPKYVRLVHHRQEDAPNLALVEGIKAAKPMLHFLPPLFVCNADGTETAEIRRIYGEG